MASHRHPSSYGQTYPPDGMPKQTLAVQAALDDPAVEGVHVNTRGCAPMDTGTVEALRGLVDVVRTEDMAKRCLATMEDEIDAARVALYGDTHNTTPLFAGINVLRIRCERLTGENAQQYREIVRLFGKAEGMRAHLAQADADSVRLQREKEESTGVIETYGRVELSPREDRDILELRWQVAGLVFRAGGFDVFHAAIRECSAHWNAKLDAIRRADRPWQAVAADAFADALRAARPGAPGGET